MSSQRYERVAGRDDDDHLEGLASVPASPPPPFRSRSNSPDPDSRRLLTRHDPLTSDADRTLAETFDTPSDSDGSDDEDDATYGNGSDRRRLIPSANSRNTDSNNDDDSNDNDNDNLSSNARPRLPVERTVTQIPVFAQKPGRTYGSGGSNDGVFANLSAKPSRGDEVDEKPPTYEQAAADATPPYWETTVLAPGMISDEVYVDGLPVGSVFSFVWNAMISMSFQIVGFLLTYLLHTTHAAKNGSRAGLGITLVQYGFSMKGASSLRDPSSGSSNQFAGVPADPNSHDFDPAAEVGDGFDSPSGVSSLGGITTTDWFAYILMIVGWFILIRSVSDFLRARRHEQLVLQSPDRGLGVPVVAEGENPDSSV